MTNNLLIASPSQERLATWNHSLDGYISTTVLVEGVGSVSDDVAQIKPEVLLLDFDLLGSNGVNSLRKLCAETKIIIIGNAISEIMEWELLKAGVRGCCRSDSNSKLLKQVVEAVQNGELWIRRTLTCRLIDELGRTTAKNKAYQASLGLLNKLTQREYDIAIRVGNGESNKQIAQSCAITERTVKAHLTEVFQKLGVTDRLNLALVLSADERRNNNGPANAGMSLGGSLEMNSSRVMGHINS
jgi:DNA-binding NarL/FixJ family response regulator